VIILVEEIEISLDTKSELKKGSNSRAQLKTAAGDMSSGGIIYFIRC